MIFKDLNVLGPRRKQSAIIISVNVYIVQRTYKVSLRGFISKITVITSSNKHTTSTSEW